MKTKDVLLIDKSKERGMIIFDIVGAAKKYGYKRDNLKRRLNGLKKMQNKDFEIMLEKIIKSELVGIDVLVCDKEKFNEYIEMY